MRNLSSTLYRSPLSRLPLLLSAILILHFALVPARAQEPVQPAPSFAIDAGKTVGRVSPRLYGLMTEEINFSYEGGIYAELIRNRTFKADAQNPIFWNAVGDATITLDTNQPLNSALNVSLKVDASKASTASPVGIANEGYWGIPVRPNTIYRASFYARAENFSGLLTLSIESNDGKRVFASATVRKVSGIWQKYEVTLRTGPGETSKNNRFAITTTQPGTIWFQNVSFFPPTYHNRPNGTRPDIMQLMADMQPKFLRFPGGNYLEGNSVEERFNWKQTLGDVAQRPGHRSPWGYWSTDGFGLLEFLEWCEDLHMEPLLAVYAGYNLNRSYIQPGPGLDPYVQEALEEIEYVTGDAHTKWGAQRARDGHPQPFPLRYVEVGNEDWFDRSGSYDGRFAQFYDAIKARYPNLQIISSVGNEHGNQLVKSRVPDMVDEHYYRSMEDMMQHALDYDKYPRDAKSKIFVGEWATRVGAPTPNMAGALGDAAWMTGMERNSDIVLMHCYAPLLVNVSQLQGRNRSMQWNTDLIGYDALNSYGSPAYHAQKMFSTMHGDEILATSTQNIPTRQWQPPAFRGNTPPPRQLQEVFFNATRDSQTKVIYVKVVNIGATARSIGIQIKGENNIQPTGEMVTLAATSLDDTNSIEQPQKVVPRTDAVNNLSAHFTREFPPYSITVLKLKTAGATVRADDAPTPNTPMPNAITPHATTTNAPTLKDAYKDAFYVGVAISRTVVTGEVPRFGNRGAELVQKDIALTKQQFNQISPENDLKWDAIHPREGADGYNFGPADAYVDFGLKNNMYIVGHTLVWHGQTPRWVFAGTTPPDNASNTPPAAPPVTPPAGAPAPPANGPATGAGPNPGGGRFGRGGLGRGFDVMNGPHASRDELLQRMRDHIHTVVGRYKGKIKVWDVVNEAISDGGPNVLRNSPWLQIIGPDFIAKAFEYAHEADPDAILRYNDYGLENPVKRQKLITLIKDLQAQKVPVMAIGTQTHVSVSSPSFEDEDRALTELESLGLPIHITELDVNSAQGGQRNTGADIANNATTTQGGLVNDATQRLATQYANLFKVFFKHKTSVKVVTLWGVNDGVSWRADGKPLLFDSEDNPKPAFDAVIQAAKSDATNPK